MTKDTEFPRTCPDCKGYGGDSYVHHSLYWMDEEDQESHREWRNCRTCQGKGELDRMQYMLRMEFGPPQPKEATGYA